MHRRMTRRGQQEQPRRLPNFPRPPENTMSFPAPHTHIPVQQIRHSETDEDIVSNPSLEGRDAAFLGAGEGTFYPRSFSSLSGKGGRPLPPVPHSRSASAQWTLHDPALAHSRHNSEHGGAYGVYGSDVGTPTIAQPQPQTLSLKSLNPNAPAFVFGGAPKLSFGSSSLAPAKLTPPAPAQASDLGHERGGSAGKPLNVAAPEFKPGSFTFRPPADAPSISFESSPSTVAVPERSPGSRPLPTPPVAAPAPKRAEQGREKRQRRASYDSLDDDEQVGNISMQSFRFPPVSVSESPRSVRRPGSAPTSPSMRPGHERRQSSLNASAPPFTFSGFSGIRQYMKDEEQDKENVPPAAAEDDERSADEADDEGAMADATTMADAGDMSEYVTEELPVPPQFKPKRAPIPLDFKHPVSTNTVPASRFKALANGNRSRRGSRDIFDHSPRPSLDDLSVIGISKKKSRGHLGIADEEADASMSIARSPIYPPSPFKPLRRASLPTHSATSSGSGSSLSDKPDRERRRELVRYDRRLEDLLDQKMDAIRSDIAAHSRASAGGVDASTQSMIAEVVSLFRAQLQESALRGLDDSQMDARGELDFQMIKDVIEQGHAESRAMLQHDLAEVLQRIDYQQREHGTHLIPIMQDIGRRTIEANIRATTQLGQHLESVAQQSPLTSNMERENLVMELVSALHPHLASMRSEAIDYDALTAQLTQAVKPHISQLIDLASDKRETAELIVAALRPLLPQAGLTPPPPVDVDALKSELGAEVRSIVSALDAHEIKEQVSDLVVERLDSRLAVRDRSLNVQNAVSEAVATLQDPIKEIRVALSTVSEGQQALISQTQALASTREDAGGALADLPQQLAAATDALKAAQAELALKPIKSDDESRSSEALQALEKSVQHLHTNQRTLATQNEELLHMHNDTVNSMNALPEVLVSAVKVLEGAHADLMSRDSVYKRDMDEVRKLVGANADLQTQLAKARSAHGLIRVEKDALNERMMVVEADRDRLRAQAEEQKAAATTKASEASALESRNKELEAALAQALGRAKTLDEAAQSQKDRVAELERQNKELGADKQQLKAKVGFRTYIR
jgi:hypothetical protein